MPYLLHGGGFASNVIDFVTISSEGNATDFGDLTGTRSQGKATSSGTNDRGFFGGGNTAQIDFVTISTEGNAADFGDMTISRNEGAGCSDGFL